MTAPTTPSPERQPADATAAEPYRLVVGDWREESRTIHGPDGYLVGGLEPDDARRLCAELNRLYAPQAQPDARAVEGLIRDCAKQFRFYEKSHAAKGTPDGDAKAIVNAQFAQRCEDALSAPAADDGWRPIESAPKDGTPVLLYPTNMTGCWDFGAEDWLVFVIPLNKDKSIAADWQTMPPMMFEVSAGLMCAEPTHWRPLPAPPVALHPAAPTEYCPFCEYEEGDPRAHACGAAPTDEVGKS